jgi:hypothetical protein
VPASGRSGDHLRVFDVFDQQLDAIAAPEQLAIEHHGGYAEHAERFGFVDNPVVLFACRPVDAISALPGIVIVGFLS